MTKKVTNKISDEDRTFIYFVRSGEFIKIGQSKQWKLRVETMQVGSPYTIITLLVLIAEPKLESKLHNWFRADHFRGEWFHSGPAILAYIREHLSECVSKAGATGADIIGSMKRSEVQSFNSLARELSIGHGNPGFSFYGPRFRLHHRLATIQCTSVETRGVIWDTTR